MFTYEKGNKQGNIKGGREGSVTFAHLTHIIPTCLQAPWALAKLAIIFREIRCM